MVTFVGLNCGGFPDPPRYITACCGGDLHPSHGRLSSKGNGSTHPAPHLTPGADHHQHDAGSEPKPASQIRHNLQALMLRWLWERGAGSTSLLKGQ